MLPEVLLQKWWSRHVILSKEWGERLSPLIVEGVRGGRVGRKGGEERGGEEGRKKERKY